MHSVEEKLKQLEDTDNVSILKIGKVGIEKESLRTDMLGYIAQTDHPASLGSTLTHPNITTDYSEALMEFVTPAFDDGEQAIDFLKDIHEFVYPNIIEECLWPASMPCKLKGEQSIRIAEYGSSNLGLMKNVYRRGLGYRYGKTMQVIAGIHVNLSMSEDFWRPWQQLLGDQSDLREFINKRYFSAIRNLQRIGWLVPYLFGASSFVDESFQHVGVSDLKRFGKNTLYNPHATSLRLGDIGYTNSRENEIGVKACYKTLQSYVECLTRAIETPYPLYEEIGVKVDNEYRQLNANILQIENEYYSTVRPKRATLRNEKPTHALLARGVEYVEIRSLDLNPFSPLGLSLEQLRFMEVLFVCCVLSGDDFIEKREREEIDINEYEVAHHGRKPGLMLRRNGTSVLLSDWCSEIFECLESIAASMDKAKGFSQYSDAVNAFKPCVNSVEKTLSAQMCAAMATNNLSYYEFVANIGMEYCKEFSQDKLPADKRALFVEAAKKSIEDQKLIEEQDTQGFDEFLQEYFSRAYEA